MHRPRRTTKSQLEGPFACFVRKVALAEVYTVGEHSALSRELLVMELLIAVKSHARRALVVAVGAVALSVGAMGAAQADTQWGAAVPTPPTAQSASSVASPLDTDWG